MIPSLLTLALLAGLARADAPADALPDEQAPHDVVAAHRVPFDMLLERAVGSTSQPVRYDWRRSRVQVAASGAQIFELNTFDSLRAGGMARFPAGGLLYEVDVGYVWTRDTTSSELLALTPYRQPGRPSRVELSFNVGVPLAEGVVTTRAKFLPAVQLVFNGYAGLRYAIYPSGFAELEAGDVAEALVAPALSEAELLNLDDDRLAAMEVDPGRYAIVAGLGNDVYLAQGVFLSPRLTVSVPLLAPISGSRLLLVGEATLAVGAAF